jgi:pyridoxine 4-dehydrogenase
MVQLHWPPSLGWQETAYLEGFGRILSEGMATQVGLSNCGPKKLREINAYAREKCERPYSVASNQVQFSLLSRYPIETELLEIAREEGVQLIGYSALGLGLLGDKYSLESNYLPSGLRGALFREFLPIMTPLLSELRAIAKSRGKTVAQVALNWSLAKGLLVLVGMRTVAQARENLGAVGWRLSAAEVDCLDKAASRVPKQLVQNSFQSR